MGEEGWGLAPSGFSALNSQPQGGRRGSKVRDDISAGGVGPTESCQEEALSSGVGAAGETEAGPAALADRVSKCFLSICPSTRRGGEGGEEDTRAEPSLTVSVELYPSPPGDPGRKEKEDRHVRTPWNVIRGEALGTRPPAKHEGDGGWASAS